MYKLYWSPNTASLAPMAVLEELGVEYDAVLTSTALKQHKTPEYLAINPCGLVPALGLPDGGAIFEGAAIIMHLCDLHPAAHLAPPVGSPDRARYYQWMLYLADTPQPDFRRYYYPDRFGGDPVAIRERGIETLMADFAVVEDALARNEWLAGDRLGACDIYLHMLTTWYEPPEALYARFPNIARVSAAVEARPACAKAIERHKG